MVGIPAERCPLERRDTQGHAKCGSLCRHLAAIGPDRQRGRRLEGFGRADDVQLLPEPADGSRSQLKSIEASSELQMRHPALAYIVAWLMGFPLGLLILLWILGVGR